MDIDERHISPLAYLEIAIRSRLVAICLLVKKGLCAARNPVFFFTDLYLRQDSAYSLHLHSCNVEPQNIPF